MKHTFILAILLLHLSNAFCQNLPVLKKEDKQMLSGVTAGATYILRQDYYLIDSTAPNLKKMGYNNNPYFGRFYFVAILADGKFYTDKHINAPWLLDSVFSEIVTGESKYKPVLGNLAWKNISGQSFREVDSINIYNKNRDQHTRLNTPYAEMIAPAGLTGLQIDTNKQALLDTTAWFWTAKAKQAKISRGNVFIDSVPSVDFDASKGKYNIEKQTYSSGNQFYSTKTVGGFIFITRASLGKVDFYLHGVISRNKEAKYIMTPLQHSSIKTVSNTGNSSEQPDTKELKKDNKISEIKEP